MAKAIHPSVPLLHFCGLIQIMQGLFYTKGNKFFFFKKFIAAVIFSHLFMYGHAQYELSFGQLAKEFSRATNDSLFITRHSSEPYRIMVTDKSKPFDTSDALIRELFMLKKGEVSSAYRKGNTVNYFKVVRIDSSYQVHIGNILLTYGEGKVFRNEEEALTLARHIVSEVKSGKPFNVYCHLYSDDQNSRHDCDLGWLYVDAMVYPVATACLKHRKGEVFMVKSQNGFHVIKMLDDPRYVKVRVHFVRLALKQPANK